MFIKLISAGNLCPSLLSNVPWIDSTIHWVTSPGTNFGRDLKFVFIFFGPVYLEISFKVLNTAPTSVESIHGTLESNEGQRLPAEISLINIEHYTTTLSTVDNMLCCPDGSVLFNSKFVLERTLRYFFLIDTRSSPEGSNVMFSKFNGNFSLIFSEPLKSVACCSSPVFESSVNLELISTDPNVKSLPEFVPGEVTQCIVESIHGTLESNEGQRFPAEISLIEIEHYTTTLSTVDNMNIPVHSF
jgi:hypothetical protein